MQATGSCDRNSDPIFAVPFKPLKIRPLKPKPLGSKKPMYLSRLERSLFGTTQETRSRLSTFAPKAPGASH